MWPFQNSACGIWIVLNAEFGISRLSASNVPISIGYCVQDAAFGDFLYAECGIVEPYTPLPYNPASKICILCTTKHVIVRKPAQQEEVLTSEHVPVRLHMLTAI